MNMTYTYRVISRKSKKLNEILEEQVELLEENQELESEVKQFKKSFVVIVAMVLLISVGLGGGIGYYYFQSLHTKQQLNETTQKVQTAEEKANTEAKLRAEQELKLADATNQNQELKNAAAKKAEEEAKNELKQKEEAEKAARKYVVANKKESNLPGLNTRKSPCGDLAGSLRVWGTAGEVLEGPSKPGACLGGDYEWYKVKWNDGLDGWSIADYLDFTGEKQFSQTGYITGYAPIGWDWETSKNNYIPKICATNQADNITYCNAQVNVDQQNYKLVVPAGDYVMSGSYKYKEYQTSNIKEQPLIYTLISQCGYTQECWTKYPDGYKQSGKVHVDVNGILVGINMSTVYTGGGL
jgi:hypothetical protein